MTEYKLCKICDGFHYTTSKCSPEYNVYFEDYFGDEPKIFRADSHEEAAEKCGIYYNSNGDYPLMNETIEVKVEKDGVIKLFNVSAEPDIHYSTEELLNELNKQ